MLGIYEIWKTKWYEICFTILCLIAVEGRRKRGEEGKTKNPQTQLIIKRKWPKNNSPILRNLDNFTPGAFFLTPPPTIRRKRVFNRCICFWRYLLNISYQNLQLAVFAILVQGDGKLHTQNKKKCSSGFLFIGEVDWMMLSQTSL